MMQPHKLLPIPWIPAAAGLGLVGLVLLGVFAFEHLQLPFFTQTGIKKTAPTRQAVPVAEAQAPRRTRIPEPVKAAVPEHPAPEAKSAAATVGAPQNATTATGEKASGVIPASTALRGEAASPVPEPASPPAAGPPEEVRPPEAQPLETTRGEQPAPASPAPSQELQAGTSTEAVPSAFHPPEVLGQVNARPGDNLELMIRRVYGFFDQQILKAVTQLNPQIANPSALEVGKAVKFPAVPVRANPLPKEGRYVQVAQAATLNEACKLLRAYPNDAPPIFLLPHWNPADGLKFGLVLKDCCPDQQTAETTLSALPASLATRARILGKEGEQAVFMVK